jgi:malonate transporter and related proteins
MSALAIVTPIFVLIAIGYLAARAQLLSPTAQKGISEFAFNFAMPALLFRSMATAPVGPAGSSRIVFAYFGGVAVVWLLATIATRLALRRPSIDAPTIAMSSVYGNIVMIGIPMVLAVVGPAGAAPMAAIVGLQSPLFWFVGILHQQSVEHKSSRSAVTVARDLATELMQNPIVIAIIAGALWRLTGAALPTALDSSLSLLGQAGIPCAQVALGASLTRFAIKGQVPTLSILLVMKLLVLPAVVYGLAVHVFALPRTAAEVALIFASMPAGANAFLFAERSQRVVHSTSGAVALGTLLGAVTSTLLIAQLRWLVGP